MTKEMKIEVFGKDDCDVCNRFKKRIASMGCTYASFNIQDFLEYSDDWRERKSYEVSAALDFYDKIYPIIRINDEYYNYALAISKIKELQNAS